MGGRNGGLGVKSAALVAAVLALTPAAAAGQMRLGVRGGVNFARVTGSDVNSGRVDWRTGALAGVFVEGPLADIVGFELGTQYAQKGFQTDVGATTATAKLDYLEVPALLTVQVPAGRAWAVELYAGPTFSFAVRCSRQALGITDSGCKESQVKSFDLGGDVGAGLRFGLGGASQFLLDGFYDFGFTSFDDRSSPDDIKNEAFSLTVGILLPAGQ